MNTYKELWNESDRRDIFLWWEEMLRNKGMRAELRRTEIPSDVFLTEGYRALYYRLSGSYWMQESNMLGMAAVAGILAWIDINNDGKSFAASCAAGNEKPAVSEERFSKLLKSRTFDELFIRMRRIMGQLKNTANVLSVADDILHWYMEMVRNDQDENPRNHIVVRWGLDYFQYAQIH
jgi:CRISPR system Cascade subunit CasB